MKIIDTYWPGSYEYEQLRIAAEQMTAKSPNGIVYCVVDTWFDYGRGIMWTTIIDNYGMGSCQALTPAEQEKAIFSTDLEQFATDYFKEHPRG